jgi:hypothetical protein
MSRREWWREFPVGTRVELARDVDHYPNIYVKAGERGTVDYVSPRTNPETADVYLMVRMDRTFPELAEWNNRLEIWVYESAVTPPGCDLARGEDCPLVLPTLEGLSRELESWCAANALPYMSADELLAELQAEAIPSTVEQREWLRLYIERWNEAEGALLVKESIQ